MDPELSDARSLATLYLLKILQEHSDADHALTQKQMIGYLENEYGVAAERKKIGRDLERIDQAGFEICRGDGNRGYYLIRDLDDSELRFLIDSVLFSKYIPPRYSESLIKKLTDLGGPKFRKKYRFLCSGIPSDRSANSEVFLNAEKIGEAIEEGRQIRFRYYAYDVDAQLHPVWEEPVEVDPHSLAITDGHYSLIATWQSPGEKDVTPVFFHLEYMKDVQKGAPRSRAGKGLQEETVGSLLEEHPLGLSGKAERVTLRIIRPLIHDLIESFGKNFICVDNSDEITVTVKLRAGKNDIRQWVLQNASSAELLEPAELREEIAKEVEKTAEQYRKAVLPPDRETVLSNALGRDGVLRLHRIELTAEDLDRYPPEKVYGAEFTFNELGDFSFLKKFQKLRYVKIESAPVTDLSVLAELPELERLELYFLEDLGSLAFLRECRKLRKLNLINNDLPADDDPPFYDMPWLQVLNASARDLRDIDMHELYALNPRLSVQTEPEDIFGSNDSDFLWTYKNWDEHRPQTYPFGASVFASIFGIWELEDYPRGYMDWLENNRDFQNVLDKVFLRLGRNEYTAFADWIMGKSIREISQKILLSCEAVVCLQAGAFRILRHPTSARLLKPFGPSCSPFADEYRENLRKKGRL